MCEINVLICRYLPANPQVCGGRYLPANPQVCGGRYLSANPQVCGDRYLPANPQVFGGAGTYRQIHRCWGGRQVFTGKSTGMWGQVLTGKSTGGGGAGTYRQIHRCGGQVFTDKSTGVWGQVFTGKSTGVWGQIFTGKSTGGGGEIAGDIVAQQIGVVKDDKVGVQSVTALRHVTRVCTHSARETSVLHITHDSTRESTVPRIKHDKGHDMKSSEKTDSFFLFFFLQVWSVKTVITSK